MKARLTILMVAGAAWLCGAADKPPSDRPSVQAGHASTMPARSRHGDLVRPGVPKPSPKRSGAPVGGGALIPNPAAGRGTPDPLRERFGHAGAPMGNIRHGGTNPAIIAGSAASGRRNAGVIGGIQVHRRP